MRGNAPQVVEALWAAKEEPPAKLVGFSFLYGRTNGPALSDFSYFEEALIDSQNQIL